MSGSAYRTFIHPQKAYRLEFPAEWENLVQDDGKSCGFGPKERDDVGLWISIMPVSLDTDRFSEDLPDMFQQALDKAESKDLRRDGTLQHYAMKADIVAEGQAGHYWIVAGGDLVLFASSQVPAAERDVWNPAFDRLMESLRITRDEELLLRKAANEVLRRLCDKDPEQKYEFHEQGIRGRDHMVYLGNMYREIKLSPDRWEQTVRHFVEGLAVMPESLHIDDPWDAVAAQVVPVLKPRAYFKPEGPTSHVLTTEWLADVLICYVIRGGKTFRFITGWDCNRWSIDSEQLHAKAIDNLAQLDWPRRLEGSRQPSGGRLILIDTRDSFAASRLLHPDLHHLFSKPLGSPFLAGIPDRDTLVAFSNRDLLKRQTARQVRKDYQRSAYQITPRIFMVTADGIALAEKCS